MLSRTRLLPLLFLAWLLVPAPAEAGLGWIDWLQEFSGPGPFSGLYLDFTFGCTATALTPQRGVDGTIRTDAKGRLVERNQRSVRMKTQWTNCWNPDSRKPPSGLDASYVVDEVDPSVPSGHLLVEVLVDQGYTYRFSKPVIGKSVAYDVELKSDKSSERQGELLAVVRIPAPFTCNPINDGRALDCSGRGVEPPGQEGIRISSAVAEPYSVLAAAAETGASEPSDRDVARLLMSQSTRHQQGRPVVPGISVQYVRPPSFNAPGRRLLLVQRVDDWLVDQTRLRLSYGLVSAFMGSRRNRLQYSQDPVLNAEAQNERLFATLLIPTFAVGVHPAFDVGFGVGRLSFSGKAVNGGWRPISNRGVWVYQPRLVFRPAMLRRRGQARLHEVTDLPLREATSKLSGIQIVATATVVPGVDASDFGALPGTFSSGPEILYSVGFNFDLVRLFSKPSPKVHF